MTPKSWQAETYFEQAVLAVKKQAYVKADSLLIEALKIRPNFVEAWILRGNLLLMHERFFDAAMHFDAAIGLKANAYDAWNNRGEAYAHLGMWEHAKHSFLKSAELMPAVEPHLGLAGMCCTLMQLEDAVQGYRNAVAVAPQDADAHFNLGVTLLGLGQWEEGFREYEWRWPNTPYPPAAYRNYQKWRGEDLSGKTILLYAEQGFGDEIMGARFALIPEFANARVILETRGPFMRLAKASMLADEVLIRGDEFPEGIDFSCPTLDVPMAIGLGPDDVGTPSAYLSTHSHDNVRGWRERLAKLPRGLNVGLCWGSGQHLSTTKMARRMKSIPIEQLRCLDRDGVNLISLQKPKEDAAPGMRVTDWTDELDDLADTADLISALDLVISVDTAVAHLAGALCKPVWNFVRFSGYWPWLAKTDDYSIWYPSNMKLLRQQELGDWSEPIAKAAAMLRDFTMERAA